MTRAVADCMSRRDHEKASTQESKAWGDQTTTFQWLWLCAVCFFLPNYGDPAVIDINPAEDWFSYARHDFFHVRTEGWDLHMRTANGQEQEMGSHGGLAGPAENGGHNIADVCCGCGAPFVGNGCFKTATCLVDCGYIGQADADTTVNGIENGGNEVNGGGIGSDSGGGNDSNGGGANGSHNGGDNGSDGGGGEVRSTANGNGHGGGDEGNGNGDRDGGGSEAGEEDDVEEETEENEIDDGNVAAEIAALEERVRILSFIYGELRRLIVEQARIRARLDEISRLLHNLNIGGVRSEVRRLHAEEQRIQNFIDAFEFVVNNLDD